MSGTRIFPYSIIIQPSSRLSPFPPFHLYSAWKAELPFFIWKAELPPTPALQTSHFHKTLDERDMLASLASMAKNILV